MKNLSSAVGIFALALGALATQSCEYADNPYGHYGRHPYDDYPRYAQDHYYTPRIIIIQKAGTGDRTRTAEEEATTKTNTVRDRSLYPYPAINPL